MSWETARARHFNWVRPDRRRTARSPAWRSIHPTTFAAVFGYRRKSKPLSPRPCNTLPDSLQMACCRRLSIEAWNPVMEALKRPDGTTHGPRPTARMPREPSFHGFPRAKCTVGRAKPRPIDFIFPKRAGIVVESHLVKDSVKCILPSDHYFLSRQTSSSNSASETENRPTASPCAVFLAFIPRAGGGEAPCAPAENPDSWS